MSSRGTRSNLSIIAITLLFALAATAAFAGQPAPVQKAIERLAKVQQVSVEDITVISAELVQWPDTSLGAPREDHMYLQVISPGYSVVLEAGGIRYEYHTDMNRRVVLASKTMQGAPEPEQPGASDVSDRCRQDLAKRLKVPADGIQLVKAVNTTFFDSSLGFPRPGEVYMKAISQGKLVLLRARGLYLYAASGATIRYAGPLQTWGASALYLEPDDRDPNLNGTLMQISLCGTNPATILPGVSSFFPQLDGSLMATRRTSRSGHDLLYVAPGKRGTAIKLASSFAFGDAVVKPDTSEWAAFSRWMVGAPWELIRGSLEENAELSLRLPLPDGARPVRLYWHTDNPVAEVMTDGGNAYYEMTLDGEPGWRKMQYFFPPEDREMVLNKSETLAISTETVDGKPVTKVSLVWFTGTDSNVASIEGFDLREVTLSPGKRFAFLLGSAGECISAVTVDTVTGEVLQTVPKTDGLVRLWWRPSERFFNLEKLMEGIE